MWNVFKNKNEQNDKNNEIKLDLTNIPKHIAIIMDGKR